MHSNSNKDIFIYKPLSKYRMGWKIQKTMNPTEILLSSSNKNNDGHNLRKTNNTSSLLEQSKSNNYSDSVDYLPNSNNYSDSVDYLPNSNNYSDSVDYLPNSNNGFSTNNRVDSNNTTNLKFSVDKIKTKTKTNVKKYNIYERFPEYFPELMEQGDMDACVPNCISTLYYYYTFKQGNHLNFRISRLFLYYNVRKMYNEMSDDAGSRIIDCIKILKKTGVPPEMTHPYHEKFLYKRPNELSNKLAKYCKLLEFEELDRTQIKNNLLENNPIVCGIKIFENFNNRNTITTGYVSLPDKDEELLGGHSIVIVGYNDNKKHYIFINSWGKSWGNNGIGYIPYEYINNYDLADEFFILTKITNPIINLFDNTRLEKTNKIIEKIKLEKKNHQSDSINKSEEFVKILLLSILIIMYNL
jgi:C1A family cysteine protease